MSLRVKQSAARERKMLDAAEYLIRQTGSTDFTMRTLATAAEVSPATPYNFFGSKEGLLFALLKRNLKVFMKNALDFKSQDPIEKAIEAAENAIEILIADPVFLRPLYQVMLGLNDPVHHPKFIKEAFTFYRQALEAAVESKLIDSDEQAALACSLMTHFMGALDLWVHEDIQDKWFRAQVVFGFIQLLRPIAHGEQLNYLEIRHKEVKEVLKNRRIVPKFFGAQNRDKASQDI